MSDARLWNQLGKSYCSGVRLCLNLIGKSAKRVGSMIVRAKQRETERHRERERERE